jgi:hypothetical protein
MRSSATRGQTMNSPAAKDVKGAKLVAYGAVESPH